MRNDPEFTDAGRLYAAAYTAQYKERNLRVALQLYLNVIASHPGDSEAVYSRMQIQNIINAVVPQKELLDAQVELAVAHLEHDGPPEAGRLPVRQLAPELSA